MHTMAAAEFDQVGKVRVERHLVDDGLQIFLAGADKIDLAGQAFARADAAGEPLSLDCAPFRIGKALEDDVRRILKRDRSVEIDEDTNP